MKFRNLYIYILSVYLSFASAAFAQETAAGAACEPARLNHILQSGGPSEAGRWSVLRCDGSVWQPLAVWDTQGRLGVGIDEPEAVLHAAGEVIVGAAGLACGEDAAGAIRFNSATRAFEGCNGWGWCALPGPCPRPGPPSCPESGDLCADGSYYIGRAASGTASITMTATDSSSAYEWGSLGTWRAATNTNDGATQSAMLAGFGAAAHPAAHHCENLTAHGHSDWYLPARNELLLAHAQAGAMGLDTSGSWPNGYYWASTEGGDTNNAVSIRMQDAFANTSDWKANAHRLRCVRKVPD